MAAIMTLDELLEQDSELFSLPEIYIRVSELMENENSASAQIGKVVETDPALSSRILKMVNSAFYGIPKTIASISQAITILGRDRLRQILIGTVLSGVFGKAQSPVLVMEDFWYHSVKTAILARHLGNDSEISNEAESLFTAGLLHEIGRLIMAQKIPEQSSAIQKAIDMEGEDIMAAESRILGFTHCDVGGAFIEKWGLPALLADVAKFHHSPQLSESYTAETDIIYLANNLVSLVSPVELQDVNYVLKKINGWERTGLSATQVHQAVVTADAQVYEVMEILGMVQMKIDLDD